MTRRVRFAAPLFCALAALAGCGDTELTSFAATPIDYLLTIDQMQSPGFIVESAPHALSTGQAPGVTSQNSGQLQSHGYERGASAAYFRDVGALALSNGPVEIVSTVEEFPSDDLASAQLRLDVGEREADPSEQPISTGQLGSEAHADTNVATAPDVDQTQVIQITVEWRLGNVLNLLQVRGRYGGTRLADALTLANSQTANELRGGAPRITASPTRHRPPPSASPSPHPRATATAS